MAVIKNPPFVSEIFALAYRLQGLSETGALNVEKRSKNTPLKRNLFSFSQEDLMPGIHGLLPCYILFLPLTDMKQNRRKFIRLIGAAGLSIPLSGMTLTVQKQWEENEVVKPPALKKGDTIAITSPAGAIWNPETVPKFKAILEGLGFRVKLGKTLTERNGYFAGNDELRARELNELFIDKSVQGIFCAKGGWGCARLLDNIDYFNVRTNPKVMMGFSDITSLLVALQVRTGLVTFHGPVGNSGWNDFSTGYLKSVLMNKELTFYPPGPKENDVPVVFHPGKAKGILVGGNLSVIAGIIGSTYLPDWKNKILFLEETEEEPYSIDRMLTQLKLAGVFKGLSGIIVGKCVKCEAEEPSQSFTFMEVLEQHIKPLSIPAYYGSMIGHIENKFTVPIGVLAEMDAGKGTFKLLEPAVL
jgi:muramoyltetrapeptide carboxypeptidase